MFPQDATLIFENLVATVAAVMTQPESLSFRAWSGLQPWAIKSSSFTRARSVSSETPSEESAFTVSTDAWRGGDGLKSEGGLGPRVHARL